MATGNLTIDVQLRPGSELDRRLDNIEGVVLFVMAYQFEPGSTAWWFWMALGFVSLFHGWSWLSQKAANWRGARS